MVLHIIRADILRAWGEEKYEQKIRGYLCIKPSNKRFIIPLQKKLFWLFFSRNSVEIHPALCICPSVSALANDVNNIKKPVKCLSVL